MRLDQFRQLAETWGGNIERWPAATQEAARALAAGEEGARILDEQAGLDRLFSIAPAIDSERAEIARFAVLQRIASGGVESQVPWFRRALRWPPLVPAASLACSLLVGLWLAEVAPYGHDAASPDALSVMSSVFDGYSFALGGVQ